MAKTPGISTDVPMGVPEAAVKMVIHTNFLNFHEPLVSALPSAYPHV
jgi:hypothetical protein